MEKVNRVIFCSLGYISGDGQTYTYICELRQIRGRQTRAAIMAHIDTTSKKVSFEPYDKKNFSKEDVEDAITAVRSFLQSADTVLRGDTTAYPLTLRGETN